MELHKDDWLNERSVATCDQCLVESKIQCIVVESKIKCIVESKIQRQLLQLKKDGLLPPSVYETIRPTESLQPRLYGLPKIHKEDLLLRLILSMIGLAQHFLAKWLMSILDPVLLIFH